MDEFELIKNYLQKLSKNNPGAKKLNDDVFFDKKKGTVISIDTYTDGIHFIDFNSPNLVIKKILRSSISDLLCKGVKPKFYFISGSGNAKTFSKKNLLQISKAPFVIEYFTNAIEANAYDIAFYLVKVYEDEIFQNYQKAITAHVKSYQLNKRFLKSKLHMSKMLLSIFNF